MSSSQETEIAVAGAPPADDSMARLWSAFTERLPLAAFLAVYLFTCYVGALALLYSDRFRTVFVVFSGAKTPDLIKRDILTVLILLNGGPLLLWIGYELGVRVFARASRAEWTATHSVWVARLLVVFTALLAGISLWRAEAWQGFAAWLDYNSYVYARWRVFDRLRFGEFVNLYTLLPLAVAYLMLVERRWRISLLALTALFVLQYPLALRKVLLTSALLIASAVYLYRYSGEAPRRIVSPRRHLALIFGGPFVLYVVYLALTLQTVISPSSKPFISLRNQIPPELARPAHGERGAAVVSFTIDEKAVQLVEGHRIRALVLYALFSPLTRTSIAALAYPVVFPYIHSYYRIDVGQDILGFGGMPDDNLIVYRVLWPEHHRGSIAAPFQFVLYAQGGLAPALAGSLLAGFALAVAWRRLVATRRPDAFSCLQGALIIVLGIFLAIDSLRNSLIVSYGLLWGMLAVFVLSAMEIHVPRRAHARPRVAGVG